MKSNVSTDEEVKELLSRLNGWTSRTYIYELKKGKVFFTMVPQISSKNGETELRPPGGNRSQKEDKEPKDTSIREAKQETGLVILSQKLITGFTVPDDNDRNGLYGRFHYLAEKWEGVHHDFKGYNQSEDKLDTLPPAWISAEEWATGIPEGHLGIYITVLENLMQKSELCFALLTASDLAKARNAEIRSKRAKVNKFQKNYFK